MKTIGIMFGNKHSYKDFGLILTDMQIPAAAPITNYINIPGRDGLLDASEELGEIKFNDRDCKFSFVVDNYKNSLSFEEIKTEISNYLNGKTMKVILDEDKDYYYYGRLSIDNHSKKGYLKQIIVAAKFEPYKLKTEETTVSATVSGETTVVCENERMSVVPTITMDADFTLTFGDITIPADAGTHIFPDIKFTEGTNEIICSGYGNITFTYQEGAL